MRDYMICVGGTWREGRAGRIAGGQFRHRREFASVAVASAADVDDRSRRRAPAGPAWAALSASRAGRLLPGGRRAAIDDHADGLPRELTRDQGKPLEARKPATRSANWPGTSGWPPRMRSAWRGAHRRPPPHRGARADPGGAARRGRRHQPVELAVAHDGRGTVRVALAAGNTVVWVPAPTTSACCALLAEIITAAGIPAGVFSFLPGPGPVVGDAVAGHPGVRAVGFIGSVATGARRRRPRGGQDAAPGAGRQAAPW